MGSDPSLTTDAGAGDDSTEASLASALLNA
jgi:hypothetical protein